MIIIKQLIFLCYQEKLNQNLYANGLVRDPARIPLPKSTSKTTPATQRFSKRRSEGYPYMASQRLELATSLIESRSANDKANLPPKVWHGKGRLTIYRNKMYSPLLPLSASVSGLKVKSPAIDNAVTIYKKTLMKLTRNRLVSKNIITE